MERQEYSIAIERQGVADLPELCRAVTPEAAAELLRALLALRDPLIQAVHVCIVRVKGG